MNVVTTVFPRTDILSRNKFKSRRNKRPLQVTSALQHEVNNLPITSLNATEKKRWSDSKTNVKYLNLRLFPPPSPPPRLLFEFLLSTLYPGNKHPVHHMGTIKKPPFFALKRPPPTDHCQERTGQSYTNPSTPVRRLVEGQADTWTCPYSFGENQCRQAPPGSTPKPRTHETSPCENQ